MELVSQKLGVNNESDVASKEVKSRDRAFCDMICLLLEDMSEGEVKDMVKLYVHQLIVKGNYRASAQGNYVESQMQVIKTIPSVPNYSQPFLFKFTHTFTC